jgi:hypothetical protein
MSDTDIINEAKAAYKEHYTGKNWAEDVKVYEEALITA